MSVGSGALDAAPFVFATCQIGAERALKAEVARDWPQWRFAFSRPGFLTFKLPSPGAAGDAPTLPAVFARSSGLSLGKVRGSDAAELARETWNLVGERKFDVLHVWQRDTAMAGDHGYLPAISTEAAEAALHLARAAEGSTHAATSRATNVVAQPGQWILDCVLVEPQEWWIGCHRATEISSCWPGGIFPGKIPSDAVSRAYGKIEEALAWSGQPLRAGQRVVEIGCAPGGASQALLAHGLKVIGIDPAEVDPLVSVHPRFTHLRKRGADVKRREFRGVDLLVADMNVAPEYTLTTVEEIVTHAEVSIAGLLLTIKLIDWELAAGLPSYLERVRSWGYQQVAARQLSLNRQEICIAARRKTRR